MPDRDDEKLSVELNATGASVGPFRASSDAFRESLRPGSRISVVRGGEVWEQTIQEVYFHVAGGGAPIRLTWWRRALRALTPRRWRRPLPTPRAGMPQVSFGFKADSDPDNLIGEDR